MRKIHLWLLIGLLIVAIVGCGAGTENDLPGSDTPTDEPALTPADGEEPQAPVGDANAVRQQAVDFLASELGIDPGEVEVVRFSEREWSNAALDCEAEAEQAATVITPGYHLLAKAAGQQHDVRTNADGTQIIRCNPVESTMDDGSPEAQAAREFLAQELEDQADSFVLVEKRAVTWRDGALGCPQPDEMYIQALTDGYQFVFERGSEQFYVHTDAQLNTLILCEDPEEPIN